MNRRSFLASTAAGLHATPRAPGLDLRPPAPVKAVLFDAFPIFDPRPVGALANSFFPERGTALLSAWRARQFEYTWLRTTGHRYRDFEEITDRSLSAAARAVQVTLTPAQRAALNGAYRRLTTWPDVPAALAVLARAGIRVGLLSNFTPAMLEANLAAADLRGAFQYVLSTDQARAFKPAPEAYQLGVAATGFHREEIVFAAFAPWDAAGAVWFGYPTVWVNRLGVPAEELDGTPRATGPHLGTLIDYVLTG